MDTNLCFILTPHRSIEGVNNANSIDSHINIEADLPTINNGSKDLVYYYHRFIGKLRLYIPNSCMEDIR